jgi:hypothetical protein
MLTVVQQYYTQQDPNNDDISSPDIFRTIDAVGCGGQRDRALREYIRTVLEGKRKL